MLEGAALGETAAETGRRLHVSEATVKYYRCTAFRKLEARNLTHAVAIATRRGLLSPPPTP